MKEKNKNCEEYDYLKAASAQDCTGLIPSGIQDDGKIENYEELYPFLPNAIPEDDLTSEPE